MFNSPDCKICQFKSLATKHLSDSEIGVLETNCAVIDLKKGDTIFKQGVFSSNIVYLKSGVVKLHIEGPYKEQIIKITKGPTYLGIPTTLEEKYYRYSATPLEKTSACFIEIETFKEFVKSNGKFAYEIIVEMCRNELSLFNKCVGCAQKNARGRIANALKFFSEEIYESSIFKLPLKRSDLGDYTNTTRESVSRILTEFNNDSIIKITGKTIEILNMKQLELISKTG